MPYQRKDQDMFHCTRLRISVKRRCCRSRSKRSESQAERNLIWPHLRRAAINRAFYPAISRFSQSLSSMGHAGGQGSRVQIPPSRPAEPSCAAGTAACARATTPRTRYRSLQAAGQLGQYLAQHSPGPDATQSPGHRSYSAGWWRTKKSSTAPAKRVELRGAHQPETGPLNPLPGHAQPTVPIQHASPQMTTAHGRQPQNVAAPAPNSGKHSRASTDDKTKVVGGSRP